MRSLHPWRYPQLCGGHPWEDSGTQYYSDLFSIQDTLLLILQHSGHVHVFASKIQRLNHHQASRAAKCFSKNVNSKFKINKITTSWSRHPTYPWRSSMRGFCYTFYSALCCYTLYEAPLLIPYHSGYVHVVLTSRIQKLNTTHQISPTAKFFSHSELTRLSHPGHTHISVEAIIHGVILEGHSQWFVWGTLEGHVHIVIVCTSTTQRPNNHTTHHHLLPNCSSQNVPHIQNQQKLPHPDPQHPHICAAHWWDNPGTHFAVICTRHSGHVYVVLTSRIQRLTQKIPQKPSRHHDHHHHLLKTLDGFEGLQQPSPCIQNLRCHSLSPTGYIFRRRCPAPMWGIMALTSRHFQISSTTEHKKNCSIVSPGIHFTRRWFYTQRNESLLLIRMNEWRFWAAQASSE